VAPLGGSAVPSALAAARRLRRCRRPAAGRRRRRPGSRRRLRHGSPGKNVGKTWEKRGKNVGNYGKNCKTLGFDGVLIAFTMF